MGRNRNRNHRPPMMQKASLAVKFAAVTHGVLNTILRFAEALGNGPQMVSRSGAESIEVGWRWTPLPDGLKAEEAGADFLLRLTFDSVKEGGMMMHTFYGPGCPQASEKRQVVKDTLELLSIEMRQKGMTMQGGA